MSLKLKVYQGTPIHGERSLCFGCTNAQVVQGQQVSDLTVTCFLSYEKPVRMSRAVVECSDFRNRKDPSRKDMERMAWILETKKGRPIGFFSPTEHAYRAKAEDLDEPEED